MPRRFIAHLCLLSLVLCAVAARAQQPKADPEDSVAQTLKAAEQAWLTAEKNNDVAAFERIVADDWMAITPEGSTENKAKRAAEIKTGETLSATLGEVNVRVFGDTAVVTGSDDEVTVEGGKEVAGHYVWTDVFVKRDGKWVAVASQTALVK